MARLRVLQVVQPPDGGVAEHVLRLASGLEARGCEVEIAGPGTSRLARSAGSLGLRCHPLEMGRSPGRRDIGAGRELRAIDRGGDYSIVHAHSSKAGALVRAALPGRHRIIYTPHCFAFAAREFGSARHLIYRAIEQAMVVRTARLVAVCNWERDLARRSLAGAGTKLRTIPNGVPPWNGHAPDGDLMRFKRDQPLAGLISVLRPQKDPLLVVRAAARMATAVPGKVAIVGEGELRDEVVADINRLGVGERVRWFPFRGDVGPYLAALDMFLLSSAWEALPLSVLEAMSCGLPVVATGVGGVPEAVVDGKTGVVVAPGDAPGLASAMTGLLSDPERRRAMGAAGLRRFEERFTLGRMVDETASLYEELSCASL